MKTSLLSIKKKKNLTVWLIVLTIGSAALATGTYYLIGLDNFAADGRSEVDPTLETYQPDEEIGFQQVANIIQGFVHDQFTRRKLNQNIENEKNAEIYKDLPDEKPYATRDVHRKTHGCVKGRFHVSQTLLADFNEAIDKIQEQRKYDQDLQANPIPTQITDPSELGVFKPGAYYDSIVRFSNGHPQNRSDRLPDARGFAVKILPSGALGPASVQASNSENLNLATVLDILNINFPVFFVNQTDTARKYYELNQRFLAGALDFSSPLISKLDELLSLLTPGINALEFELALKVNGSIIKSPLYQEYFSMVPSRLGTPGSSRAVKYIWQPTACPYQDEAEFNAEKKEMWPEWANRKTYAQPLRIIPGSPGGMHNTPPFTMKEEYPRDYLRKNLKEGLEHKSFCYALYLQPYVDQKSTNTEDSTDVWLRSESERESWLAKVVPSKLSPFTKYLGFDQAAYINAIRNKRISPPVRAATLELNKLEESVGNNKNCEDLSFSPWHGDILHHQPLGVISRLKRRVYNASRRMRFMLNGFKDGISERQP